MSAVHEFFFPGAYLKETNSIYPRNGVCDGQISIEDIVIKKIDSDKSIGEMSKIPEIKEIDNVNTKSLNENYLAFIKPESLELIKKRLGKDIEDVELIKKLVVFKKGTSIYFDKNNDSIHFSNDIISMKTEKLNEEDCPSNTEHYIYLANLTDYPKWLNMKHTTIIDSKFQHPITFAIKSSFSAKASDAIEPKISIKNRNGIINKPIF